MGVVPLATNSAAVIVVPLLAPPSENSVKLVIGPSTNVPFTVSPVPAALEPVLKSLSNTCASVPATLLALSARSVTVTTSLTGSTVIFMFALCVLPLASFSSYGIAVTVPLKFRAGVKTSVAASAALSTSPSATVIMLPVPSRV